MRTTYIVVTVEENGKYCSYDVSVTDADNLVSKLNIKGIKSANICSSKKVAKEIASAWNETYKRNGAYMYS